MMVMFMTITSSLLLISYITFVIYDYSSAKQSTLKELNLVIDIIGKRVAPIMLFQDPDEAYDAISAVKSKESVILACLFNEVGKAIAVYKKSEEDNCDKLPPIGRKADSSRISVHKMVTSPNGNNVASIYIVSDLREVNYHMLKIASGMITFLILSILVTYVLVRRGQRVITRPIMNLVRASESVSQNDYSVRAIKFYNDECGILADAFNSMVEKIERREVELKDIVDNRTEDLRFTIARLEKANEDKKRWIQNIGHEIRTPIHGMINFSNYGVNEAENKKVSRSDLKHYFDRLHELGKRLEKLIEGLLDFGKMEAGKLSLNKGDSDLMEVMQTITRQHEPQILEKNIKVKIKKPKFTTKAVFDRHRITQVAANLLSNAIKFSPQDGVIEISFRQDVIHAKSSSFDGISVLIRDYGIGIPDGEEEVIFDTFTQSSKTDDGSGGTGLGLSISREIILAHQGKITASNNADGQGSTFTFTIPFDAEKSKKSGA